MSFFYCKKTFSFQKVCRTLPKFYVLIVSEPEEKGANIHGRAMPEAKENDNVDKKFFKGYGYHGRTDFGNN